jgi:molecular chaperone DnaK
MSLLKTKVLVKNRALLSKTVVNLSKEDVEKAAKEAEANAAEDKKKREAVDAKNGLENAIYQLKIEEDNGEKLADDDKKALDEAIEEAKKSLEKTDKDDLEKASQRLDRQTYAYWRKTLRSSRQN